MLLILTPVAQPCPTHTCRVINLPALCIAFTVIYSWQTTNTGRLSWLAVQSLHVNCFTLPYAKANKINISSATQQRGRGCGWSQLSELLVQFVRAALCAQQARNLSGFQLSKVVSTEVAMIISATTSLACCCWRKIKLSSLTWPSDWLTDWLTDRRTDSADVVILPKSFCLWQLSWDACETPKNRNKIKIENNGMRCIARQLND